MWVSTARSTTRANGRWPHVPSQSGHQSRPHRRPRGASGGPPRSRPGRHSRPPRGSDPPAEPRLGDNRTDRGDRCHLYAASRHEPPCCFRAIGDISLHHDRSADLNRSLDRDRSLLLHSIHDPDPDAGKRLARAVPRLPPRSGPHECRHGAALGEPVACEHLRIRIDQLPAIGPPPTTMARRFGGKGLPPRASMMRAQHQLHDRDDRHPVHVDRTVHIHPVRMSRGGRSARPHACIGGRCSGRPA